MRIEELDFAFPEELIAQHPAEPRDSCRLMHLDAAGAVHHRTFTDLPGLLRPGDTLVFNDSRVLPARMQAQKPTGGKVELLFLRPLGPSDPGLGTGMGPGTGAGMGTRIRGESWEALARPSHRLKPGGEVALPGGETVTMRELLGEGRWSVEGPPGVSLVSLMERYGTLPLPPYIHEHPGDPESYQTVYAARLGSAAAPTAGLHFTPELLVTLRERGVSSAYVTLHVGLDTFQPIREEVVEEHRIHRETYSVSPAGLATIQATRLRGGRIVAVGTTATRVLETVEAGGGFAAAPTAAPAPRQSPAGQDLAGDTDIYITPGHEFKAVDLLLTNFHLPRSSVLVLTMAFAGVERLLAAYEEAIALRYRFFSFGDAMLVEPLAPAQTGEQA